MYCPVVTDGALMRAMDVKEPRGFGDFPLRRCGGGV